MTERETIQQAVQDKQCQQSSAMTPAFAWPLEFGTEGHKSSAFPILFPTGAANFLTPCQFAVTIGYFFSRQKLSTSKSHWMFFAILHLA